MQSFVYKNHRILTFIVIALVVIVAVVFGFKKHGFYIDEYYLYTVSNGNQFGIAIEPGKWNDTSDYKRQLVSEGEENFRFRQIYETESGGVHPPLYYYLLHFMSSIFSGVFSKWIGICLNIIILVPMLVLVEKFAYKLSGGNTTISILTLLLFGLSPATISMVVFVRMYLLLGLWTLLYAYLHVLDLERGKLSVSRFLLPVFVTGFLGFLTQYFFVIIMFFITFVYAFYLMVFCRRVRDSIIYGITALLSLICTHLVWPYAYFHIFEGYRGQGAMSQFWDYAHLWERIKEAVQWMDKLVFARTFPLFAIFLSMGIIIMIRYIVCARRDGRDNVVASLSVPSKGFVLILTASLMDFFALTQIALFDGIECSRQFYTAYVLFLVLIPIGVYKLIMHILKANKTALICTLCSMVILLALGYIQKNVIFLYENEKVALDYATEHPDAKVVMFENDDGNYDSRIQELMLFPKVFYVSVNDLSKAKDSIIADADKLLVYVSTSAKTEDCFNAIYEQNSKITKAELICKCYAFFDIYEMR